MSDALTDLMLRNAAEVFSERDASRRLAAMRTIYADDSVFFEGNDKVSGRAAISARVDQLLAKLPPDFLFTPEYAPERIHDLGRLAWRLGPPAGPSVGTGMDVALFKDGRIQSLYVFVTEAHKPGA